MPENVLKALNMVFEKNLAERQIENRTALAKLSYELQASEAEKQRNFEMLKTVQDRLEETKKKSQEVKETLYAIGLTKAEVTARAQDGAKSDASSILGIATNNILNKAKEIDDVSKGYESNIASLNQGIESMQELQNTLVGSAGVYAAETFKEFANSFPKGKADIMDTEEMKMAFDKMREDKSIAVFVDRPGFKQMVIDAWDKREEHLSKLKSDASLRRYRQQPRPPSGGLTEASRANMLKQIQSAWFALDKIKTKDVADDEETIAILNKINPGGEQIEMGDMITEKDYSELEDSIYTLINNYERATGEKLSRSYPRSKKKVAEKDEVADLMRSILGNK